MTIRNDTIMAHVHDRIRNDTIMNSIPKRSSAISHSQPCLVVAAAGMQ